MKERTIGFQFQLGTIGTCCLYSSDNCTHISIPVRYDWNEVFEHDSRLYIKFQFQLGTIGTLIVSILIMRVLISIPVRYDWNYKCQILLV